MEFNIDEDFALLYGIMLGDGCLSLHKKGSKYGKSISITGSLQDDVPFFENIIQPLLIKFRGKPTKIKVRSDCRAIEYNFSDVKLFDFIHSIGFPIGKKGTEIDIHQIFYEKKLMEKVIAGFFATDGSLVLTKNPNKFYPRLEAHAICKKVIFQICEHLNGLGLEGHVYLCKRNKITSFIISKHKKYRFQFNGKQNLLLFANKIGFANPKYNDRFAQFVKYEEEYKRATKGVNSCVINGLSDEINKRFINRMAAPRIELGTPSS